MKLISSGNHLLRPQVDQHPLSVVFQPGDAVRACLHIDSSAGFYGIHDQLAEGELAINIRRVERVILGLASE